MELDRGRTERIYDRYSSFYDRTFGRIFMRTREALLERLPIGDGERVLEVGVGTGLSLPLYPDHCDVVGIDLSDGMLRRAADRVERHDLPNVNLLTMDAGEMSFPDSSFDLVIAAYVVTAVPDHRALMREIVRVSRPGGRVVLLNHFMQEAPVVAAVERAISPLCARLGFRTDLSVEDVIGDWPLAKVREEPASLFGLWQVVECVNEKAG